MNTEKIINPPSGYMAALLFVLLGIVAIVTFSFGDGAITAFFVIIDLVFILPGLIIVNPNESKVLTLFGNYEGTVKKDGFFM